MIYICIPSHNEERTIGILLWKIRQVLTLFPRDYQLLVLDDASDDRTPEVLAPYARILPLTVLRHERRKGYAASLDELIREAVRRSEYPRRDVVLTLQADFSEEPDEIPALLKRIESGADVVTTRVRIAPEHAPRKVRWMRAGMTRLLRRLEWPENVTDMLSGLRAYRVIGLRKALEASTGARLLDWHDAWAANAALLRAVKPHVRRVDEVEAQLRPDRLQRPSRFDPWATARQLARLAFGRPSGTPVPAREGGAILVSAEELAAAARELRPSAPAPGRRGPGGARSRQGAAAGAGRRPARSETEAGQPPARGRRAKGERSEGSGSGERSGRGERVPRPERPPRPPRARAPRQQPAADTVDAALETGMPAAPKSRRRRRGSSAADEAAGTGAPSLEGIADVLQGAAPATELTLPPGEASEGQSEPAQGAPPIEGGMLQEAPGLEEVPATGRKRRRRSSRRGRGKRERAGQEGAEGGVGEATAAGETGPEPQAGEREPARAGGRSGREPGAAENDSAGQGEGAPDGAQAPADGSAPGRPRRRSRRGGRGRSRRRAGAEAGAAGAEARDGGADTAGAGAVDASSPAPAAIRALLPPGRPERPAQAPAEPGPSGAGAGAGPDVE